MSERERERRERERERGRGREREKKTKKKRDVFVVFLFTNTTHTQAKDMPQQPVVMRPAVPVAIIQSPANPHSPGVAGYAPPVGSSYNAGSYNAPTGSYNAPAGSAYVPPGNNPTYIHGQPAASSAHPTSI
jgi:hypothetical protein